MTQLLRRAGAALAAVTFAVAFADDRPLAAERPAASAQAQAPQQRPPAAPKGSKKKPAKQKKAAGTSAAADDRKAPSKPCEEVKPCAIE